MRVPNDSNRGRGKRRLQQPVGLFPKAPGLQYPTPAGPPVPSQEALFKIAQGGPTVNGYKGNPPVDTASLMSNPFFADLAGKGSPNSPNHGLLEQILNPPHGGPSVDPGIASRGGNGMGIDPGIATDGSGIPGGGQRTIDYQKAAADIYAPALNYLTGAENQAKGRNKNNDRQLASMYAGLVKSIAGDAGNIKGNYSDAIKQIAQGTQETQGAINNTYDESANEQMQMLKQLGIEAAAPDTLKNNTRDEAFFKNMVGTSGQSAENMLAQQRAGALEYNTAQQNISRQSGADARANNMLSLEDTLNQIMGRKADLQGEINKTAMSMQSSAADQQIKAMADQHDWEYKQAQLELQKSKLALMGQNQQAQQDKAVDPWTKLAQVAGNIYPNEDATRNAVKAVRDTVTRGAEQGQEWTSPNQFINAVLSRNQGANDSAQLTQLASYLYQLLYGR